MEKGLTKEHSLLLYGVAILLMVCHHLFGFPERLHTAYISIGQFYGRDIEFAFGVFGKMCVAIYAFISGYGMFRSLHSNWEQDISCLQQLRHLYRVVLGKLFAFFKIYWTVFFIFIPLGLYFFDYLFDKKILLFSFIGLDYSYNGEWWYIGQYIKMLLWFPLIDYYCTIITRKRRLLYQIGLILLGIIFICKYKQNYVTVFIMGYLFAKMQLFEKLCIYIKQYKIPSSIIAVLCLLSAFTLRRTYENSTSHVFFDAILVPVLIYGMISIIKNRLFKIVICELGNKSVFMWLTHSFFCYYYFQEIVMIPQYSFLIYLWLVFLSYVTACILSKIHYMFFLRKT